MKSGIVRIIVFCILSIAILDARSAMAERTYSNPVLVEVLNIKSENPDHIFGKLGIGDPAVIFHEGKYYLYPTGDNRGYDVYISSDMITWEKGPRVFMTSEPGAWAPDVFHDPHDRKFYLYYTVNRRIGVAAADRPDGTFQDMGTLVNGAIDAHMFLDENGRYYLYFVKYPSFEIYVLPMESPVKKKVGQVRIIQPAEPWEKKNVPITEAPWMLRHKGTYYLLYSGGSADTEHYAIGYATAKSPMGPFTRHPGNPIIKKGGGVFGPGHASVTRDLNGKLWMIYHQQYDETKGWNRIICIDPLWFDDRGVLHGKATRKTRQPAPVTVFK
jgi:beta-xylosidase